MTRHKSSDTMFHEVSDDDSIATDSTAPSEPRDDYPVERILCEQWNPEDECTEYLIKWEGYPLERANYEPAANFVGDAILPEWELRKKRIDQGLEEPFNEDDWYKAIEIAEVEKDIRHSRRKAKRRKRGNTVSPDETDNNEGGKDQSTEEDIPLANRRASKEAPKSSPAKKRVKQPEVQRKGVAQKITSRRRARSASSSSESSFASEDSRVSLFEEAKASASAAKSPPRTKANESSYKRPSISKMISEVDKTTELRRDSRPTKSTQQKAKQPTEKSSDLPSGAVVSSAARKSAPSTGTTTVFTDSAKATAKDIFANWTAAKKPRQRPRVSGDTPKDSDGSKFTNLAMQNRFQKYSRNEKAPDLSALTMLDPRTGKPKAPPSNTAGSPLFVSASPVQVTAAPTNDIRRDDSPNIVPLRQNSASVSRASTNETTCHYWLQGRCKFSPEDCKFAHYDTGIHAGVPGTYEKYSATYAPPPESTLPKTCYWWKERGWCSKSDSECQFAHYDTGTYAPRPATFREGSTASAQQSGSPVSVDFPPPPPPSLRPPPLPPSRIVSQKETTCWWWLQPSGCNKADSVCKFAHYDTGVHAGRPGSYREAFEAKEQQQSNPNSIAVPPPPPPAAADSAVLQQVRPLSAANATSNAGLLLCLGGTDEPLRLSAKLEVRDSTEVERLAGKDTTLRATRVVTVDDFKNIASNELGGSQTSFGGIHINPSHRSEAEAVTEMLNRHDSALVAAIPGRDVHAIIWPGRAERWKYLDDGSVALSDESVLHFRMFPNLPGFAEAERIEANADKSAEQQHHALDLGELLAGLDSDKLLPKKDGKPSDRAVFLMFPQTHNTEIQVCAEYFQGAGLRVYRSETVGAWDHFRRTHTNACSIVIHPDVPIWEIPGLYNILSLTAAKFFTLGTHRIAAELESRKPAYGCDRIFPHGNVAFITDDVFVHYPEKATEVIKAFLEANKHKPEGGENNRIATRPGVKAWLLGIAMEKTAERGRQDERWLQLYDAICKLCPPEDEDPRDEEGNNPLPTSNLISPPPEHLASFDGMWEKDETASTDYMVNWFAGWAIMNASKYRRFVVCHEPKESRTTITKDKNGKMVSQVEADPRGWARKYQHIGVVLPGKVAGMLNSKWKK